MTDLNNQQVGGGEVSSEQAVNTTSNAPAGAPATEVDHQALMGILAYLGILVIIPYLVAKDNSFVKFHIGQGLTLLVLWVVIWFIGMIPMVYMFSWVLNLIVLVLAIIGIVNVIQKKETPLPLIGQFARHFKI